MLRKSLFCLIVFTLILNVMGFNRLAGIVNAEEKNNLDRDALGMLEQIFNDTKNARYIDKLVDEVKDIDGSIQKVINTDVERIVKKDEVKGIVKVVLNQNITYTHANGNVEKERKVDEIEYTKSGEFFVNGIRVPIDELNQTFNIPSENSLYRGFDWLTYYSIDYSGARTTYFYKAYKSPKNNFLDPPGSGPYFNFYTYTPDANFQSLARDVETNRMAIVSASYIIAGTVANPFTWANILGWIGGGTAVAGAALTIYINSSTGKANMLEAYRIYN